MVYHRDIKRACPDTGAADSTFFSHNLGHQTPNLDRILSKYFQGTARGCLGLGNTLDRVFRIYGKAGNINPFGA